MPENSSNDRHSLAPWVYVIALIYFALHLATATRYGYFRDALYYIACSYHLAFGYVDQPPMIALLAWIARHTLGTSLTALLFWPALAGAGRIVLVAALRVNWEPGVLVRHSQLCWLQRLLYGG